jgi:hypothetical protein
MYEIKYNNEEINKSIKVMQNLLIELYGAIYVNNNYLNFMYILNNNKHDGILNISLEYISKYTGKFDDDFFYINKKDVILRPNCILENSNCTHGVNIEKYLQYMPYFDNVDNLIYTIKVGENIIKLEHLRVMVSYLNAADLSRHNSYTPVIRLKLNNVTLSIYEFIDFLPQLFSEVIENLKLLSIDIINLKKDLDNKRTENEVKKREQRKEEVLKLVK